MRRPGPLLAALALLCALGAGLPPSALAVHTSTLGEYRARVERADEYLAQSGEAWRDERSSQAVAATLNTLLPGTERVTDGSRVIEVDNGLLRSLIARLDYSKHPNERRETLENLRDHLDSLRLSVDQAGTPLSGRPQLLRELLARPDLASRPTVADQLGKLMDRLSTWFAEWFQRLLARRGTATASDVALAVVVAALAALLVYAGVRVARAISRSVARHDERVLAERAADAAVVEAAAGLPPDALGYAESLAAEGRFRDAVRALFGGAARSLVELGLLPQTRTRTNAELLGDLAPVAPPVLPPLAELSATFERAWYGHADPGAEGFAEARERYRTSVRAAERVKRETAEEAAS
jgi:hypothetical protein